MKNDIICQCGHEKKYHGKVDAPIWDEWCNGGRVNASPTDDGVCVCCSYIPDNLLHIEMMAKKKGLV